MIQPGCCPDLPVVPLIQFGETVEKVSSKVRFSWTPASTLAVLNCHLTQPGPVAMCIASLFTERARWSRTTGFIDLSLSYLFRYHSSPNRALHKRYTSEHLSVATKDPCGSQLGRTKTSLPSGKPTRKKTLKPWPTSCAISFSVIETFGEIEIQVQN